MQINVPRIAVGAVITGGIGALAALGLSGLADDELVQQGVSQLANTAGGTGAEADALRGVVYLDPANAMERIWDKVGNAFASAPELTSPVTVPTAIGDVVIDSLDKAKELLNNDAISNIDKKALTDAITAATGVEIPSVTISEEALKQADQLAKLGETVSPDDIKGLTHIELPDGTDVYIHPEKLAEWANNQKELGQPVLEVLKAVDPKLLEGGAIGAATGGTLAALTGGKGNAPQMPDAEEGIQVARFQDRVPQPRQFSADAIRPKAGNWVEQTQQQQPSSDSPSRG